MPAAPLRLALAASLCCATNLSSAEGSNEPDAAAAAAAPAGVPPPSLVWPSWGWDITRAPGVASRTECFNATDDSGSDSEEATGFPQPPWHNLSGPAPLQWVHWAAPAGPVPPTGFPVFIMFEVEGWRPPNGTCGNPLHWPVTYGPFSTPDESISWAFMRNGSLNQSVASSESPEADFPQAGLMWIQRIKQLLLANGVGVVILNPLVADGWDWDTLQDWNNGTDRPYLHKLFTAMADGSFPAGGNRRRLFDTNRVVPAGYSVGAQST